MEVRRGEILGLVGPNGSGKTTAFRLAAGILNAGSGEITVFGGPPGTRRARSRQGYMPEQPGVPESLTPAELLHFVGRVLGMKPGDRERRIGELAELLSMGGFLSRRMAGFSKGMVKRVGLAAALFHGPEDLGLNRRGCFTDLIQKQGAAIGFLEKTGRGSSRSGKGPFFITEQGAFQK